MSQAIVIEPLGSNDSAYFPNLPRFEASRDTGNEADVRISDEIGFHTERLRDEGDAPLRLPACLNASMSQRSF